MTIDPSGAGVSAIDRWNQLYHAMASLERRMLLYSLIDVPKERRLPLPEAAMAPQTSLDAEQLSIHLQHSHLPLLADAGYVRWEREPFCVQRGPNFEEVETVFTVTLDSIGQFPESLIDGCEVYEELYHDTQK